MITAKLTEITRIWVDFANILVVKLNYPISGNNSRILFDRYTQWRIYTFIKYYEIAMSKGKLIGCYIR